MAKPDGLTRSAERGLNSILERNIEALVRRRDAEAKVSSLQDKIAAGVSGFSGSMSFVYLHLVIVSFWVAANLNWIPHVPAWDDSFVVLAMVASVEAIFLSTFVLITQNRMAAAADKRADLDLQISLLTEHELTKLAGLIAEMANKLGVSTEDNSEIEEIKRDVAPEAVLERIEKAN
jgi:uncharacterized membrane protein